MKKHAVKLLTLLAIMLLALLATAGAENEPCSYRGELCNHNIRVSGPEDAYICTKCGFEWRNSHVTTTHHDLSVVGYKKDIQGHKVLYNCSSTDHTHADGSLKTTAPCTWDDLLYVGNETDGFQRVCDLCHTDASGFKMHKLTDDDDDDNMGRWQTYLNENHCGGAIKCTDGCDIIVGNEHQFTVDIGHKLMICNLCNRDKLNNSRDAHQGSVETCPICKYIPDEQPPADNNNQNNNQNPGDTPDQPEKPDCSHKKLVGRRYVWLNDERHTLTAACADCGEEVSINERHINNPTWHNGTVCVHCRTDANGVKHNWSNGECTVCPKPIPDGLNPDDGWYYEGGEKSDFTGLAEYNGSLFYVEDGQWQKELDGLKLIGDEFWYLAGGQVQEHHGFALYDGEWFYLDGGKLDITASGLFQYDGEWFLVAAGRLVSERKGLAQLPNGDWYYIADGRMVQEYSGVVQWAGDLFEVANGKMLRWIGPGNRDYHGILNGWY